MKCCFLVEGTTEVASPFPNQELSHLPRIGNILFESGDDFGYVVRSVEFQFHKGIGQMICIVLSPPFVR